MAGKHENTNEMSETKAIISKLDYFYTHTCTLKVLLYLLHGHSPNFRDAKTTRCSLRRALDAMYLITDVFSMLNTFLLKTSQGIREAAR